MAKLQKASTNFTQVSNLVLSDERLSWKAKGLYAYLFSKPDNWSFSADRIKNEGTDGRESIQAGLRELEALGYISRKKLKNGSMIYYIGIDPITENPDLDRVGSVEEQQNNKKPKSENPTLALDPKSENPTVGKPHSGKTPLIYNTVSGTNNTVSDTSNINSSIEELTDDISDSDFSLKNENPVPEIINVPPAVPVDDPKKIRADFLKLLRTAFKIDKFKDENEWTEAGRTKALFDKLGQDAFVYRMKVIMSDKFKLKNCNRLSYLRKEIESFIDVDKITNSSNVC